MVFRNRFIQIGVAVLLGVFEELGIKQMGVSDEALREGLLYDLMGRIQHEDARERTVNALSIRWSADMAHAGRVRTTAIALLDKLAGKSVKNTQLVVRRLESLALLDQCQLVFISEMSNEQLDAALTMLHTLPVLTVSDMRGFTKLGGIIEFRIIDNKVRFDININAAESAGLRISSKLLSLATRFRRSD